MKQTVNSYNQEFGYELLSAVPHAYELHLKGELKETISAKLSEPLYYFSPKHTINPAPRSWYNTAKARSGGLPYTGIHQTELQPTKFPDYKGHFANDTHKYDKPTLCICNRANIEWGTAVINYFDAEILDWLFDNLKDQYHVIYFPINIPESIQDNAPPKQVFDDISIAEKHGVHIFTGGEHWNVEILKTFANCEHYITMNGGYSILASFFSGTNIIYSKPGKPETQEIRRGSFWRWYPNINNVRTLHVRDYDVLKLKVKALYIDKFPTANVIIRTSNRPNGFRNAIESVLNQDYSNVNIIVTVDDKKSNDYTKGYPCRVIPVKLETKEVKRPNGSEYGRWFPANNHIDIAQWKINDGYIFFLDDDDIFLKTNAISTVISQAKKDHLMIWKVKFPDKIIPNGTFGTKPTLYDITGIGMCYHESEKLRAQWWYFKRADYRVASEFDKYIWIDNVLTGLQSKPGYGQKIDVKPVKQYIMKKDKLTVRFVRKFQNYQAGEIVTLPWVVGVNYIHRQACVEHVVEKEQEPIIEPEQKTIIQKEEKTPYQTKEEKPKRTRKTKVKDESQ